VKARIHLNFFDYESLEKELKKLHLFHQIAFAAACCERMLPNYNYFCRLENFGNPDFPRAVLNEIWQNLEQGTSVDTSRAQSLIDEFDNDDIFPDDLDYGGQYCYEAQEALLGIINVLGAFTDFKVDLISSVARHARNTIEVSIPDQESFNVNRERDGKEKFRKAIANHPWTVRELAKETEDLQRLKQAQTLDRELLEWLRTSFNNDGKSLIDLS
jgi:uncharacterized protein